MPCGTGCISLFHAAYLVRKPLAGRCSAGQLRRHGRLPLCLRTPVSGWRLIAKTFLDQNGNRRKLSMYSCLVRSWKSTAIPMATELRSISTTKGDDSPNASLAWVRRY